MSGTTTSARGTRTGLWTCGHDILLREFPRACSGEMKNSTSGKYLICLPTLPMKKRTCFPRISHISLSECWNWEAIDSVDPISENICFNQRTRGREVLLILTSRVLDLSSNMFVPVVRNRSTEHFSERNITTNKQERAVRALWQNGYLEHMCVRLKISFRVTDEKGELTFHSGWALTMDGEWY